MNSVDAVRFLIRFGKVNSWPVEVNDIGKDIHNSKFKEADKRFKEEFITLSTSIWLGWSTLNICEFTYTRRVGTVVIPDGEILAMKMLC
jgi:hypothetical protein